MSSFTFVGLAAADSFTTLSVGTKLQNKVLQHAYPADHASNRASYSALHRPNFTPVRQKDRANMDPVGRSLRRNCGGLSPWLVQTETRRLRFYPPKTVQSMLFCCLR